MTIEDVGRTRSAERASDAFCRTRFLRRICNRSGVRFRISIPACRVRNGLPPGERVPNVNHSDPPPDHAAFCDSLSVCIASDETISPGPVVVALDSERVPQRVIAVEVLTTLGALAAFTQMRVLCPDAAAIVSGIASPDKDGASTRVTVQLCEPASRAEAVWWQQLLRWAAHRQSS